MNSSHNETFSIQYILGETISDDQGQKRWAMN